MAKRRKRSKKWLYWVFVLLLLILAGVVIFLVWENYFKDSGVKSDDNNNNTSQETEKKKEEKNTTDTKSTEIVKEKEKVVQYEGTDPNEIEKLTGVMTYAGVSGSELMIRVNIDQYLASGTCELAILSNGTNIYSSTSNIIDSAMTSTCEGFNVPVNRLGSGNLQIVVYLSADGKTGEITGEVNI